MYGSIKDFTKELTHEEVYNILKDCSSTLMCFDSQYNGLPSGKIERVHVGKNGELVKEILNFNYSTYLEMFARHRSVDKPLPRGPWYLGHIEEIDV